MKSPQSTSRHTVKHFDSLLVKMNSLRVKSRFFFHQQNQKRQSLFTMSYPI
uniref:Uncharacterized protein n=1 Tax=Piliocolobus tephrosceles TaxID=591936 RepID=A0A8C9HMY5_9PRIM